MNRKQENLLSLISRLAPAAVLIYAGFIKATAPPEEFAFAIDAYKIFPVFALYPLALAVPWIEIYLGVLLAAGLFRKHVNIAAIALFVTFEIILISTVVRGIDLKNCGCFGSEQSGSVWTEIILNIAWIIFLYVSLKLKTHFTLDKIIERSVK